jgi:protein-S-isoprenylcysteine O-methyltransferase Ste14
VRRFTEIGGWWVLAQFLLLGALAASWFLWGEDWGVAALITGAVLVLGAAVLIAGGFWSLRRHISPYPEPVDHAELIVGGVYRFVRHPIYGGIVLGGLGLSLIDGNATGITLTIVLMMLFYGKSGFEERRLIARFPEYLEYREQVRCRLLPGVC